MTKEEYLSRVASIRREMCEQVVAVTSEYIKENPGKVDELDRNPFISQRYIYHAKQMEFSQTHQV